MTPGVADARGVAGDQPEGQREQRVAGQDRDGLAEDLVIGEPAAAIVVVVHGRQVVVDERVRVDQLERAGGVEHGLGAPAHRLGAGDDEDRAAAACRGASTL